MLALMLEQMRSRVYEDEYPELKARRFIPVSNEVDTGAETFAYEETNYVGEAKVIYNYADDLPTVATDARKVVREIVSVGDSYIYTIQDIRRAAFSGKDLTARKAVAARRLWERKLDAIAAKGEPGTGITDGFLTSQQILDDMNALQRSFITTSRELYTPNWVLMPTEQFLLISHTRMSTTGDRDETLLQAFRSANPWIQDVQPWNLLNEAGAGSTDRMCTYFRDPEIMELQVPQEFEVLPPQPKNLAFNVLCHGRTAGTTVFRPLGMRYMDGI